MLFLAFSPGLSKRGETEGKRLAKRAESLLTCARAPAAAVALIPHVPKPQETPQEKLRVGLFLTSRRRHGRHVDWTESFCPQPKTERVYTGVTPNTANAALC